LRSSSIERRFTPARARALATALELEVHETGVCRACLCFVSFAIDSGDEQDVRRQTFAFARPLWEEGLALPVRLALEKARVRGVPDAVEAIADIELRGSRSPVVRAIVRKLGEDLLAEMKLPKPADVVPLRRDG
jgi:hypothetical protein